MGLAEDPSSIACDLHPMWSVGGEGLAEDPCSVVRDFRPVWFVDGEGLAEDSVAYKSRYWMAELPVWTQQPSNSSDSFRFSVAW